MRFFQPQADIILSVTTGEGLEGKHDYKQNGKLHQQQAFDDLVGHVSRHGLSIFFHTLVLI
jgi:hypothetical protein